MKRGSTFLWRKTWTNPLFKEDGKRFSRLEAWLYMTNVLAVGMDDEAAGLKRGEFIVSVRHMRSICRDTESPPLAVRGSTKPN
jgi:hypothetical protein